MKKTVFISSTYRDLKEYRTEVWDTLERFNLKVLGMEKFGAKSTNALETCLEQVRKSDTYLGIIGMVYGSVDSKTGKSYTQLEYEEAVKYNKEILIYLIDNQEASLKLKHVDFVNHDKLIEFKKILKDNHTVDFFSNPNQLGELVNKVFLEDNNNLILPRPKSIYVKLYRQIIIEKSTLFILGYKDGIIVELWIAETDQLYIPPYVMEGVITEVKKTGERTRYDFEFHDKQGYVIILPAINRIFDTTYYNIQVAISSLLSEKTTLGAILNTIDSLYAENDFIKKMISKLRSIIKNNFWLDDENKEIEYIKKLNT